MIAAHELGRRGAGGAGLAPVSFEVAPGECLGVSGPPGSGRTTLLDVVATAVAPTSGRLLIDGIDAVVRVDEARRRLASARGSVLAGWGLQAAEYVEMVAACRGVDPFSERVSQAWQALGRAGVHPTGLVNRLGPAERAALSLAAAYITRAPALVIDDRCDVGAAASSAFQGCLTAALDRGAAILLVTDDAVLMRRVCRRELQLPSGSLRPLRQQSPLGQSILEQA